MRRSRRSETETDRPGRRPARRLAWLRTVRLGLAGQVLTFAAMVIPIVLRRDEQIIALVFSSAISTLLLNVATLGYGFVFPVIRGRQLAAVGTLLSVVALTLTSLLVLPLSLAEDRLGVPHGTFAGTAGLLWTLGLYTMLVSALIRADDTAGIGRARMTYGAVLVIAVTLACLLPTGPQGLVVATSLAYLAAVAVVTVTRAPLPLRSVPRRTSHRRRLARVYLRRVLQPTLTGLAGGWAFLMAGISLPALGLYAAPWAVVSRISGGYATLLQAVLAPPVEAKLARAIRDNDMAALTRARRSALVLGSAVAATATVTSLALAVYASGPDGASRWFLPVFAATVLFWTPQLATAPISRLLNFLGRDRSRLIWETARAVGLTAAFLFVDGVGRLVVMGGVITLSTLVLLPMTRVTRSSPLSTLRRWREVPGPSTSAAP